MSEVVETPVTETQAPAFSFDSGKSEPTVVTPVVAETPVVEEPAKVEEPVVEKVETPVAEVPKVETVVETPKFANEESEKVAKLLAAGDIDGVREILNEQKKLADADKLSPEDAIKLKLQYDNKDKGFTAQEIQDLFDETYEYPEKPIQALDEIDEDFEARTKKYEEKVSKIDAKIARDAKPAIAELQKLKAEIKYPEIKTEPTVSEPTQEELDAAKLQADNFNKKVSEDLTKFNGYTSKFKDEEVELDVDFKPTKELKTKMESLITMSNVDAPAFLREIGWLDKDNQINTTKLAEDLPLILDKNSVFNSLISDTGNKRHAESIKAIKNIDYSGRRDAAPVEEKVNPVENQKKAAQHFFQNA